MDEIRKCPLYNNKELEIGICFDINCYIEDGAPAWTVEEDIQKMDKEQLTKICRGCKYHFEE